MKIPVKTIELVSITKEVEVIKEVTIPDFVNQSYHHFQDLINYLKTLDFIASSTCFSDFESFISEKQGGDNTTNLDGIALLDKNMDRVTYKVVWEDSSYTKEVAYIIFRIPKSY